MKAESTFNKPDELVFFTSNEVCELLRIELRTLKRWCADNKFPKGYRISNNKLIFRKTEIDNWLVGRNS